MPVDAAPLRDVRPLDAATYVPRNTTALLDAIGLTVDRLGQRLANTPESDRPGQVIVAILTDGLENASTRHTWPDIAARFRHQQEKYNWRFLFLGANQDAIATAARLNIGATDAATFCADTSECRRAQRPSRARPPRCAGRPRPRHRPGPRQADAGHRGGGKRRGVFRTTPVTIRSRYIEISRDRITETPVVSASRGRTFALETPSSRFTFPCADVTRQSFPERLSFYAKATLLGEISNMNKP